MDQEQTSFYILTASKLKSIDGVIPAIELIKGRVQKGYWPLNDGTRHRKRFKVGDKILLYAAGAPGSRGLAGSADLSSACLALSYEDREQVEYEFDYLLGAPYGVKLSDPIIWGSFLPIEDLVDQLDFIPKPDRWWTYLQGGASRITEQDYWLILNRQKELAL